MMKKILPITVIATSILTTMPVVTACTKSTDDIDFKPVFITWNYRQGEYAYPIAPLSEQTVDSKEALTKLYLNDVYENPEILANDIILSYYLLKNLYILLIIIQLLVKLLLIKMFLFSYCNFFLNFDSFIFMEHFSAPLRFFINYFTLSIMV